MTAAIDFEGIYRAARSRVVDPDLRQDVAQTACLYALSRTHETAPWQLVLDAFRVLYGRDSGTHAFRRPCSLEHVDELASVYPTPEQLVERWQDEESEDQADEWRRLSAADRDRRAYEAHRALGSSER